MQEAINVEPCYGNLEMESSEKRVRKAFPIESLVIECLPSSESLLLTSEGRRGGVLGLYFVALTCDQLFHFLPPSLPFPSLVMSLNHLVLFPPTFNTGSSDCSSDFCLTFPSLILFYSLECPVKPSQILPSILPLILYSFRI